MTGAGHNNGGWQVSETVDEVLALITKAEQTPSKLITDATQAVSQAGPASTIVLDLSGGVLQTTYSAQHVDVIVINHDKDEIAAASKDEPEHVKRTMTGDLVRVSASTVEGMEGRAADGFRPPSLLRGGRRSNLANKIIRNQ